MPLCPGSSCSTCCDGNEEEAERPIKIRSDSKTKLLGSHEIVTEQTQINRHDKQNDEGAKFVSKAGPSLVKDKEATKEAPNTERFRSSFTNELIKAKRGLSERGERLADVEDSTSRMRAASEGLASTTNKLLEKQMLKKKKKKKKNKGSQGETE